eukprot:scaffold469_cov160-Amphora_coffeaeformis.AAC.12
MSEEARLRLLMEVAGTTVYDQKKAESLTKMQENSASIAQIAEILRDIQGRLEELQAEKEELTHYQSLDRQRRALEYSLYDKEWQKARSLLEQCEDDRAEHAQRLSALDEEAKRVHDQIRHTTALLHQRTTARQRQQRAATNHQEDVRAALQDIAARELALTELRESLAAAMAEQTTTAAALQTLEQEILQAETNLHEDIEPQWNAQLEQLEASKTQKATVDQKIRGLYAKQGRGRHFATKADRDEFLQNRLQELDAQRIAQVENVQTEQERLAHVRRSLAGMDQEKTTATGELQKHQSDLEALAKQLEEASRARLECQEERKQAWRQREGLTDAVRQARETVRRAQEDLRKTTPRATSLGLEALTTIVEQEGLVHGEHYFGPVLENFALRDPKYQTAVEVAAQNALFHVIVDTDETASRLLKRLEDGKLGRVTFLPLAQLRVETAHLPTNNADVRPLMEHCLDYDRKVERALRHVFGKKLLCRSLDLATEWSTKLGVDGITLDGDLCSRKGSMTGGYIDLSKSRLKAFAALQAGQTELQQVQDKNREIEAAAKTTEQQLNSLMQQVQRLGAKHAQLGNFVTQKESQVERIEQRKLQSLKTMETLEKTTLPPLQRELQTLEKEIERLREEVGTELVETLSEADRELLEQLKQSQVELEADIQTQSDEVAKLGLERQKLQSILHDNLYKRRRELTAKRSGGSDDVTTTTGRPSFSAGIAQKQEELEELERELDEAKAHKERLQAQYDKARAADEKLQEEEAKARIDLEQLRSEDAKYAKRFEEAQEQSERLLNKRSIFISKRETYMRKIQELGSLPPPAELEKFSNKSISELMKTLDHVNKKLKAYSHVNKKAFDQYVNFNEQREQLIKRKEELDQGAAKVEELIENLDRQKDEAINRTFRDVSKHFKDVFKELVPNGEGELILKTAMDETMQMDEEVAEKEGREPDVSLYRGIGIKVRFAASGETYMMSQLSGGQKALVALCIIFSIQRCDPAPFYLFDELDQALDSTYRSAVADLIKKQSESEEHPTQFIVSTFRPELVDRSERWFGIGHQNKVSSLYSLSKKDALHFIANLMNEEEAVGEVTSLATSKASRRTMEVSRKRKGEEASSKTSRASRKSAPT